MPAPGSPTTMRHSSGAATTPPTKRSSSARTIALVAGAAGLLGSAVMAVIMLSGGQEQAAPMSSSAEQAPPTVDAGAAMSLDGAVAAADGEASARDAAGISSVAAAADAASVVAEIKVDGGAAASSDGPVAAVVVDAGAAPTSRLRRKKVEVPIDAAVVAEVPETLSLSAQAAGVDPLGGAIRACATSRGAKPSSTVYVVIDVLPSGRVREARVTSSNDVNLSACVSSTLIRATFAVTQKGGSFRKIYLHQ